MAHEDYVSIEQAKALKKLGFDWECNHYYHLYDELSTLSAIPKFENFNKFDKNWSAPTLSQVQKWLREKYNLSVEIYSCLDKNADWVWDSFVKDLTNLFEDDIELSSVSHQTYENALSSGIDKALELLKQRKQWKINTKNLSPTTGCW